MNGFVKSGLTLALTLCACGTAYPHAHLLQSAPTADAAGPPARQRDGKAIVHFEKETGKNGIQRILAMVSARACDGAHW
jgi:hypothetical protein